jgi:hypothetical protein
VAKFKLQAGADLELLTKAEVSEALTDAANAEAQRLSGVKPIRFQMQGVPAGGAITLGDPSTGSQGSPLVGPEQGYMQVIRHLSVEGLTAGATPDIVNVFRNSRQIWQLTGNAPAAAFGKGVLIFHPGEVLYFKSGTPFAATGTIVAHGTAWNVPAELVGKLF